MRAASHLVAQLFISAIVVGCSRSPHPQRFEMSAHHVSYGGAMADVARRFELLGRAAMNGRFELADYELGELSEVFETTLPHAEPPHEGHPEVLPELVTAFAQNSLPDLRTALVTHDAVQASLAFGRTAASCNACHQASGHGFIEVPAAPGQAIPDTRPVRP